MRLWELAKELYLSEGNAACAVEVESEDIKCQFGTIYNGELCKYGGLDGRVGDIPAYLGDCDVITMVEKPTKYDGTKYIIFI